MKNVYQLFIETQQSLGKSLPEAWQELEKITGKSEPVEAKKVKPLRNENQRHIQFYSLQHIQPALEKIKQQYFDKYRKPYTHLRKDILAKTGYSLTANQLIRIISKQTDVCLEDLYNVFETYLSHYGIKLDKEKDKNPYQHVHKALNLIQQFMKKHNLGTFNAYNKIHQHMKIKISKGLFAKILNHSICRYSKETQKELIRIANFIKKEGLC